MYFHKMIKTSFVHFQQIEEELKQSIFCKNKELDRLRYKKKNLEDVFLNKKVSKVDSAKQKFN